MNNNKLLNKIISGGQTGVDRAALDYALNRGIPCGGWCPAGRLAEDGIIPGRYPMEETVGYPDVSERTIRNISESDATLILQFDYPADKGTEFTILQCEALGKPFLIYQSKEESTLNQWLMDHRPGVLNIAGPRESNAPGIYSLALKFLTDFSI